MTFASQANDLEARALWHLQLDPALLFADCAEEPSSLGIVYVENDDAYFDYDEDDCGTCTHCGGEGWGEVDDPLWDECDEYGYGPCASCHGTGERRHQWVF